MIEGYDFVGMEEFCDVVGVTRARWLHEELFRVGSDGVLEYLGRYYLPDGGADVFVGRLEEWDLSTLAGFSAALNWVAVCREEFRKELGR